VNNVDSKSEAQLVPWTEFLESYPPGRLIHISGLIEYRPSSSYPYAATPDIRLHCDDFSCDGMRFFEYVKGDRVLDTDNITETFLDYRCKNCEKTSKRFALALRPDKSADPRICITTGFAFKFGEMPAFGPHVPSRLIKLIGPDKDIFLTGRRAEGQGMGIGAFTYYRRVVENQKNRILEEIAKVAEKTGFAPEHIATLNKAKQETQFSTAMDMVKKAIPPVLLIDGQNPLTLLHSALSEGLHAKTDEECLQLATSIRIVLTELTDRISQTLKDEATLKKAVSHLLRSKSGDSNNAGK